MNCRSGGKESKREYKREKNERGKAFNHDKSFILVSIIKLNIKVFNMQELFW